MSRRTFHDWFAARGNARKRHYLGGNQSPLPHRRPLRFEPLEDRRMLTITVNTLVDENDGIAVGGTSLRDAIAAATAGETISFGVNGTITLEHGELLINKDLVIVGSGANLLTIDANGTSRALNVDDGSAGLINVNISGLTLTGGITGGDGGGILNRESLSLIRCVIVGNQADDGGGIGNFGGTFTIVDSTISGNVATGISGGGGGIFNFSSNLARTSFITNSTVSGNSTTARGGGVNNFIGTIIIELSTIAQNDAPNFAGAGIASWGDQSTTATELYSTIVAGNINTDVDLVGSFQPTFFSNGFNLIGSGTSTGSFMTLGDQRNVADPQLGPLADYGGPTPTHALLVGSPAIDAGDPAAEAGVGGVPEFDQRGTPFGRVFDGDHDSLAVIDIGAFETDLFYFVVDTLADEDDGDFSPLDFSLREAIGAASLVGDGTPVILFDSSLTSGGPAVIQLSFGELAIGNRLVIDGPGADQLTIDGQGNARIFNVDDGNPMYLNDVAIRGLTIAGGFHASSGGGIFTNERLTVSESVLTGNEAQWGGGIYNNVEGELLVVRSTVSGNSASVAGAGIYNWGGTTSIFETTVSGNDAGDAAGILNGNFGAVSVEASTISGNHAIGGNGGGILQAGALFKILNSTISGNVADGEGGGIQHDFGPLEVRHSTITANRADADNSGIGGGGGIFHVLGPTLLVDHTIVAGNLRNVSTRDDVVGSFDTRYSLIGDDTGASINDVDGSLIGTGSEPIDPLLGTLADNGGPTWTHTLLPGSPAIDAGDSAAVAGLDDVPLYDQRGVGFDRIRDGNAAEGVAIDVGAYEVQQFVAGPELPGDYNLDETVDAADYTIWRDTLGQEVDFYEVADGDGDGTIDPDDYDVWKANFGNTLFGVGAAAFVGGASGGGPILVTTLADVIDFGDGLTSLREAVFAANTVVGPDTIEFAASLTSGGPATILITLGELAISDSLTINGPGANRLTIDASGNDLTPDSTLSDGDDTNDGDGSRIFDVDDGNAVSAIEVAIGGLTLTGADAGGYGGAIQTREILTVREAAISGNFSFGGGGIYAHLQPLVVENSTISGNAAVNGGGIFGTEITITNSTISGNTAFSRGGGILSYIGEVRLSHSTVTGNRTETNQDGRYGGGIFRYLGQPTVLDHTIVANNLNAGILPDDLVADVTARFSLIGNGSNVTINDEGGNLIGTFEAPLDPLLAPLADNGGPTWTHALRPLSPALDVGDPTAVAGADGVPEFDQRGNPLTRVFDIDGVGGPRIDIGAYEAAPFTFVVDTLADELDGDYSPGDFSLREALELANTRAGHDTIEFASSLTAGGPAAIVLTLGELAITDVVTINGPGAELLTVDAAGNDLNPDVFGDGSRIFNVDNNNSAISIGVEIRGLTLTGGDASQFGGAILSREELFAESLVVTDNQATLGGAIALFASGGDSIVADSLIAENKASSQGGAFYVQGSLTGTVVIRDNTIADNTANRGGALYAGQSPQGSTLILTGNSIRDNAATQQGGAIYLVSSSAPKTSIRSSLLSGNTAGQQGGALFASSVRDLAVIDCQVIDNKSLATNSSLGRGGGIYSNMGDLAISGSTISGNTAAAGGGVHSRSGELSISFCTIANNSATAGDGGGIYSSGDRLSIIGSTISGNTATGIFSQLGRGGGLWHAVSSLAPTSILDSVFTNNSSTNYGGGADFRAMSEGLGGSLTLTNVDFTSNTSSRGGGLAFALGGQGSAPGSLVINDGLIAGNAASMNGGGVYGRTGLFQVNGTTISGNQASGNGGGMATSQNGSPSMTMSFVDAMIANNSANSTDLRSGNGGGIWISSGTVSLTLLDTEVSHNSARQGGGISRSSQSVSGTLSAVDSTISGNTATIHGGGIYNTGNGVLSFTRTVVAGNVAGMATNGPLAHGGGIFNRQADLSFVNSLLTGNSSLNGRGGGLYHNLGDVSVTGSTISGNFARQDGGGVWGGLSGNDRALIQSSTISGNSSALGTGGLYLRGNASVRHSTITKNVGGGTRPGGLLAGDGSQQFKLDHTIVAGNIHSSGGPPDVRFFLNMSNVTIRSSLIGDNTTTTLVEAPLGSPDVNGNLIGRPVSSGGSGVINPFLAPLANNGGPTSTHALLPDSPALDAGTLVSGPPQGFDQRGNPFNRMVDGTGDGVVRIDMGAYESQGVPSFSPGDYNRNGIVDAADYTVWRNSAGALVTPFELADGDGDGMVDADDYGVWKSHFGAGLVFTLGGGGSSIAVAPEPMAPAPSAASLVFASQPPALPGVGVGATNRFARSLPAGVVRQYDALAAWLAAQPRGSSANDDAFARDADETTANDAETDPADTDPIEVAIDSVFAAFGV